MSDQAAASNEPGAIHSMAKKIDWGPYKELKGLEIARAYLIHGATIPGNSVQTSLQTTANNPSSKTRGISMKLTALGLACQIMRKDKPTEYFIIPTSNLIICYDK